MWDRTYTVPNRFGLRTILVGTALFAVVFTLTKAIDASLRVVAPTMSFVVLIGLAQMLFGKIPRRACATVGGVLFPTSAWIDPFFEGHFTIQTLETTDLFWLLACGVIAGYLGGVLLAGLFLVADQLRTLRGNSVYAVPRRFGMSTLLLATTLFSMLFAFLQWARVRPEGMFFFTAFVATVSLSQMVFERSPRWASILAGGLYLPVSMMLIPLVRGRPLWRDANSTGLFEWILIGLCVGYLGGALVAGLFLACDYLAKLIGRRQPDSPAPATSSLESDLGKSWITDVKLQVKQV